MPKPKVECINLLINVGWWAKDDELVQRLDLSKLYLQLVEGNLYITDGETSVLVADYETLTVQSYDSEGEENTY